MLTKYNQTRIAYFNNEKYGNINKMYSNKIEITGSIDNPRKYLQNN